MSETISNNGVVDDTSGTAGGITSRSERGNFKDIEIKKRVAIGAERLTLMSAMRLNRHERRALAKANNVPKIIGSTKPVVKQKKRD